MYRLFFMLFLLTACQPSGVPAKAPADVRFEVPPESQGKLERGVIQTTMQQHLRNIRPCYEAGLGRNPQLKGRVVIRFLIGADGLIVRAVQDGVGPSDQSELSDPETIRCVVQRLLSVRFPSPDGGVVVVRYNFYFDPNTPLYAAQVNEPEPWPDVAAIQSRPSDAVTPRGVGQLAPEVIQHTVRQIFGEFKACYEKGLLRDANLRGRVAARFVIGLDGRVVWTGDGGSDLSDPEVVRCVIEGFRILVFPPPERGVVQVVYPISFSPTN